MFISIELSYLLFANISAPMFRHYFKIHAIYNRKKCSK